jgi:general secretion pathway protein K
MSRREVRQRGFSLLVVTAAVVTLGAAILEFNVDTEVEWNAAVNARDEMRAHFLARSGMEISRLVIKLQKDVLDRFRKYLGDVQVADYLPLLMGAFGGKREEVENLAGLIGNIDTAAIKGLGLPEGEFDVQVATDDGKINVNCAGGAAATQKQLETALGALLANPGYDRVFEERDGDGEFTDRPTLLGAIIDYIDRDTAAYGKNGEPENYGYEGFPEPYLARDNYLDSIDELQLVRGMDDRRWALFGRAFTAYGGCKVNLGAAQDPAVILALLFQAAKDPNDPILRDPVRLLTLVSRIAQARALGVLFTDTKDFIEFVKNPDELVLLLGTPEGYIPAEGMELDPAKLGQIARTGGRRTYRVTAVSKIGRVEKTITAVYDTEVQNQHPRDPAYPKGTWVYWREE